MADADVKCMKMQLTEEEEEEEERRGGRRGACEEGRKRFTRKVYRKEAKEENRLAAY